MTSFLLQENGFFLLLESNGNIILQTSGTGPAKTITSFVDIALIKQDDGTYDIAVDTDGDLVKTQDIDTAIYMSLMTDKRAASSEVSLPQNQRGWWGNLLNADSDYEIGSKMWLLDQSRRTQDALNKGQQWVTDCLQWLVMDGYIKKITVTPEYVAAGMQLKVEFN